MNLPNKLTLLRVLLIPVFMVFAEMTVYGGASWCYLAAGIVFAVASFTDYLDGHIARKNNLVTDFGKFADPLADKVLTTVAFLYMLLQGVCSPIVLAIVLAREFTVSGVRMMAAGSKEGKVIAANMWGKAKTVLQMVTIIIYYFGYFIESRFVTVNSAFYTQIISFGLCWLVALLTAVSGIQYVWQNRRFVNTAK